MPALPDTRPATLTRLRDLLRDAEAWGAYRRRALDARALAARARTPAHRDARLESARYWAACARAAYGHLAHELTEVPE